MGGVKDKIWFLREGLFAKYVIALVGLVVPGRAAGEAQEEVVGCAVRRTSEYECQTAWRARAAQSVVMAGQSSLLCAD
jgi:hypothetical protein